MPGLLMLHGQAEVDGQAVRIAPASIPKEGYMRKFGSGSHDVTRAEGEENRRWSE